jgi:uncharacterized protein (TIGR03083 family)
MTVTVTEVEAIPAMSHREAMKLAEVEAGRLLDVVEQLRESDWSHPTDCVGWDVKALLSHVLGAMEGNARAREFVRQYRAATKAAKRSGLPMIDEMTGLQVRDHAPLSIVEMTERLRDTAPKAVCGRRRMPGLLRAVPFKPGAPVEGTWKVGFLVGTIMNRDYWMHRVDLTRATGTELLLTPDHDGRIVADVVAEWAAAHHQPFSLTLDGPAGATFVHRDGGEELRLDAVEFCRTLSGRAQGVGLLNQEVPF